MTSTVQGTTRRTGPPRAGIDSLLHWIVRLVWLNVWWMALTLLGGIVLGIGTATVAAGWAGTHLGWSPTRPAGGRLVGRARCMSGSSCGCEVCAAGWGAMRSVPWPWH